MSLSEGCYICGPSPTFGSSHSQRVGCKVCGQYDIWEDAALVASNYPRNQRYILSGAVREQNLKGIVPNIRSLEELRDSAALPADPIESIDRIVQYVNTKQARVNGFVAISTDRDYPIAYAKDAAEFGYFLSIARETFRYLVYEGADSATFRLTPEGWRRLAELKKDARVSNKAFVAMWFDRSLNDAWEEGIKPALEATGYNPVRIDLKEHNDKICDQIVAEIRKSGLLVADFTGNRGGVYFEAGFGLGLGIPVIWMCREGELKSVHFDTRQYNHIAWKNPADLKERLVHRIEATCPLSPDRRRRQD
jgi:nucleoside 2-deoxyribosyltransferase